MHTGRIIFSQLMDFLPKRDFDKCVRRYGGNYRTRKISCFDHFLCMTFAKITYRESLRDIETCLRAVQSKLYHTGIRGKVSRNTLAKANEKRDWRIYADFAQVLIRIARKLYAKEGFGIDLEQAAYAFDYTTIDLCLSLFPWARFRKRQAAVKLHTLIDLRRNIPCFISITEGKTHDVNILDELVLEPGAFYVMDRAYIDFNRLYTFTQSFAYFVVRAESNLNYSKRAYRPADKSTGVRSDQTIILKSYKTSKEYPDTLRRVSYFNAKHKKTLRLPDQQFYAASADHRTTLQEPLAGGIVLQVDQTKPSHQSVLRNVRKRCKDPNLDRHQCLRAGSNHQERTENRAQSQRNSANSLHYVFRESSYI